jgi:energy-coupling factor transporter ATP-binding protein EcfA2
MLTRLTIRNFKRIEQADIELGGHVVFVGPNNSGKTSALQALALWHHGLRQWVADKSEGASSKKRTGVTLNRKDLFALPVPHANLLWRDLHVRSGASNADGKPITKNILIQIECSGVLHDRAWTIALEFDYSNSELLFCRPVAQRLDDDHIRTMREVAADVKVAILPPMSGLASEEPLLPPGRVNVLIGQGRTAEVLRNLCYAVAGQDPEHWRLVAQHVLNLFGVKLDRPTFDATRGELTLSYKSADRVTLDISSAGRGLQQTLLLLTYLYAYRGSTILLDEPDAHLEVLRQRQTYDLLTSVAASTGSQIVAATHSEQVLNQAAGRDTVIAFLGSPHRINDQGSQLRKALLEIGYEHYLQAQDKGWVLYLEGSTDAAILERLARRLGHPAATLIAGAYVDHLGTNRPVSAQNRFRGLREAVPGLQGLALFDRLERELPADDALHLLCWRRREIENYVCTREALLAWAAADGQPDATADLVTQAEAPVREQAMQSAIERLVAAFAVQRAPSPWGPDMKVSEAFLEPLFANYHQSLGLPEDAMRKKRFYELADFIPVAQIDPEVQEKLDAIAAVAAAAHPAV